MDRARAKAIFEWNGQMLLLLRRTVTLVTMVTMLRPPAPDIETASERLQEFDQVYLLLLGKT